MNYEEAMKAAKMGHSVAPVGKPFYVYCVQGTDEYRRVRAVNTMKMAMSTNETFYPTPYEKMMTWEVYNNPLSFAKFIEFVKRVIPLKISSNPA